MTGIRSWMLANSEFGDVVMIEHVSTDSPFWILPSVPDPGKRKDRIVRQREAVGRLLLTLFRPLIKTVGRNQAAARLRRLAECWLLSDRLRSGIDHLVADVGVFRPERNQSPT